MGHRDNCHATYEDQTVPLSEYISCQELGYENSISCQEFSCYPQNRNSYLSRYVGLQFLLSVHNGNHLPGQQSSNENLVANEGMGGSLRWLK